MHAGLPSLPLLFLLMNQYNADVNKTNHQGLTPLCLACECGEEKVAEVCAACDTHANPSSLLSSSFLQVLVCVFGAAMNNASGRHGWTALHYSAHGNSPELIR